MRKLLKIAVVIALAAPALALAQFTPDPVQYLVSPEVPGPGQQVSIEVQGVGTFLGDATITWSVNGKAVQTGAGLRTYTLVTGAIGSVTTVHIAIQSQTNGSFSKDIVLRPSTVNLVWEADTSAPPFFAGKTLYSAGSPLKIVAFPTVIINGARVSPASLSYQWSVNDDAVPAESGLGRSSLSIAGDQLQAGEDVSVDVYFGTGLIARGAVSVPASQPLVVLYERDALRGLLTDVALPQGVNLTAKELTVMAQPYYFANSSVASGALQYSWLLNGDDIAGPDSARGILTLRQTGSGAGQANLSVSLQNNDQNMLVQAAASAIDILFGQNSGGSLFGI